MACDLIPHEMRSGQRAWVRCAKLHEGLEIAEAVIHDDGQEPIADENCRPSSRGPKGS